MALPAHLSAMKIIPLTSWWSADSHFLYPSQSTPAWKWEAERRIFPRCRRMHFLSPGDWLSRLTPERDWKSKFFVVCGLFCHCCCAVLNGSFITICNRWIKLLFGKWKVYTAGFDQGVCQSLGRALWPGTVETSMLTLVCVIGPWQSLTLHLCALQ